ncbi:hypothetical protein [Gemmata sp.]|uniref:hypothetical protein n=1 Tax=Gemmata sp. TaxID=1914242 RepID=UPI003F6FBF04
MADLLNINLAKALKLKNRLAGRVTKLTQTVQLYNSTQETAERIDVRAAYAERADLVRRLTELKLAVAQANAPIQRDIFTLAELKAEVALLAGLNTKHGTVIEGYPTSGAVPYVAQFRKAEVDAATTALETRIDALQDKLDAFNATTTIAVDRDTVAVAEAK